MYDAVFLQKRQRREELYPKPPHETEGDALEMVVLQKFVKVNREQLEGEHEMAAEMEETEHLREVVVVLGVVLADIGQNLDLDQGLVVEFLLVADDFGGDNATTEVVGAQRDPPALGSHVGLVVFGADDNPKAAGTEIVEHLVPVAEMVAGDDAIITALVVVGTRQGSGLRCCAVGNASPAVGGRGCVAGGNSTRGATFLGMGLEFYPLPILSLPISQTHAIPQHTQNMIAAVC